MYVPIPGSTSLFHLFCKYPILLLVLPVIAGVSVAYAPQCGRVSMVSFSFDDGRTDTISIAYPILEKYGYTGTAYIITGLIGTDGYMASTQIRTLYRAGWEIGSHSVTHRDLTTLGQADLTNELRASKNALNALGVNVQTFASPEGLYNTVTIAAIMTYYYAHRTAENTAVMNPIPISDKYLIQGWVILNTTSVPEVKDYIDKAMNAHAWIVLVFHTFNKDGRYSYPSASFEQIVQYVWSLHYEAIELYRVVGSAQCIACPIVGKSRTIH